MLIDEIGDDGFSVGWILTNDREILVTVECHAECPRNRRRGHHEYVWKPTRIRRFSEFSTLLDAKPMLLIDDHISQIVKSDIVLDKGMRPDDQLRIS